MSYYQDQRVTLYCGDALTVLRELPAESVQCCITSPPYWGLRDYGTAVWEGGEAGCDHRSPTMRDGRNEDRPKLAGSESTNQAQLLLAHRTGCGKCGAVKLDSQLGLEPTPELYVSHMVAVFREVRRVLRDDGTLWLNLGDSYAGVGAQTGGTNSTEHGRREERMFKPGIMWAATNLKAKDLVGIPWSVAFALRADGWYLRADIIWAKPNPMPESVTDRPTKAHEYLFLLSKRERYYYDAEAIKEQGVYSAEQVAQQARAHKRRAENGGIRGDRKTADFGRIATESIVEPYGSGFRNRRSVWTIATEPYPEAHFATFPTDLVKPCVLAGSKPGDVILDPFAGSGTTVYVAKELNRRGIGIELNAKYLELAVDRLRQEVLPFRDQEVLPMN